MSDIISKEKRLKRAKNAYKIAFGMECDDSIALETLKVIDEYNLSQAMDELYSRPITYYTNKPDHVVPDGKKAKEIALDVATNSFVYQQGEAGNENEQFLTFAEKIFQWLIKFE